MLKKLYCQNFKLFFLTCFKKSKNIYFWCICVIFCIFSVFLKELKIKKVYIRRVQFLTYSFQNHWSILSSWCFLFSKQNTKNKKRNSWIKWQKMQRKKIRNHNNFLIAWVPSSWEEKDKYVLPIYMWLYHTKMRGEFYGGGHVPTVLLHFPKSSRTVPYF
jgi:hypothetical protein